MALEPGTHGIISVEPLRVRDEHAGGEWSCAVCGVVHAVDLTWVLTFQPEEGPATRLMLCRSCAEQRQPILAVIDVDQLTTAEGFEDLVDHLRLVEGRRTGPGDDYVPVRDADLHRLAEERGVEVTLLVDDLETAGVARRRGTRTG